MPALDLLHRNAVVEGPETAADAILQAVAENPSWDHQGDPPARLRDRVVPLGGGIVNYLPRWSVPMVRPPDRADDIYDFRIGNLNAR